MGLSKFFQSLTNSAVRRELYEFEIVEYKYPIIKCRIKCSSGTYIRTVINDLGEKLGSYATVKGIRRISIGAFNVSEAIPSSQLTLENKENILRRIINI